MIYVKINLINQPRVLGVMIIPIFNHNVFVLVPSEKKIKYAKNPDTKKAIQWITPANLSIKSLIDKPN